MYIYIYIYIYVFLLAELRDEQAPARSSNTHSRASTLTKSPGRSGEPQLPGNASEDHADTVLHELRVHGAQRNPEALRRVSPPGSVAQLVQWVRVRLALTMGSQWLNAPHRKPRGRPSRDHHPSPLPQKVTYMQITVTISINSPPSKSS